ncbi:MAG: DUF4058 family protein [Planctomycetota bacterium]|nr:DUF4058 family protein [Planctomycetota bacterium]
MPIHDWTRVEPGDFHHFHQRWIQDLAAALNGGLLPRDHMALAEQVTGRPIPDVVTLRTQAAPDVEGGVMVATAPPTAKLISRLDRVNYARRADRVVIRHGRERVVAIIEIVSPGNKDSRHATRSLIDKAVDILTQRVNLLIVDLFPPTPRDPYGIHKAIWDEFAEQPDELPPGKRGTAVAYLAGDTPTAYVEPLKVGDALPSLPIFLSEERYVPAPLETTYLQAWSVYPEILKRLVEPVAG